MRHFSARSRLMAGGLACVAASLGLLIGCSGEGDDGSAESVVHRYTVRGRIVQLPDPSSPASELRIHHEAIEDFKHGDGSAAPMASMTMPFPLAPEISLKGFEVDDVVRFSFEVQWEPSPEMHLTMIEMLSGDTVLLFDSRQGDR